MSTTTIVLAQGGGGGMTAVQYGLAFVGAGLALGGGAAGAAIGDAIGGAAVIQGVARQPEAAGRLNTTFYIIIGLAEGMYFINLAIAALMIFALGSTPIG